MVRLAKSSSAAKPKFDFLGESFMVADMSTRSRDASLLNSASKVDIKGLRDIGLLPELERLALVLAGEGKAGEAALRKGLLEERLSCRPGEGRLSGIDGSANMMPSATHNPAGRPNQTLAPRETTGVLCAIVGW
jgi:hypothetical protein